MLWPTVPTCHAAGRSDVFHYVEDGWRAPEPARQPSGVPFRTCNYCGSISAEDLVAYSKIVTLTFEQADWKYGWPHKFYVTGIPNPQAGKTVQLGASSRRLSETEVVEEPILGVGAKDTFAKWYNVHLLDGGYDYESFVEITDLLKLKSGIEFSRNEGKLLYSRA